MRDKISLDSQLGTFCTPEEKSKLTSSLENTENWLYEDGFDAKKSVYADKLKELKVIGDVIEFRQTEAQQRPNAMSALQRTVEKYNTWLNTNSTEEQYSHITEEELQKCREIADSTASW